MAYLFFDTETTGLPANYRAPVTQLSNWPRLVQLAWVYTTVEGMVISKGNHIIKPDGFIVPEAAAQVHGISHERAMVEGIRLEDALLRFRDLTRDRQTLALVAHNAAFDEKIVGAEFLRLGWPNYLAGKRIICTMKASTDYCAIPSEWGFKWPKLQELHRKLFKEEFSEAHNAAADIGATVRCFFELQRLKVISV